MTAQGSFYQGIDLGTKASVGMAETRDSSPPVISKALNGDDVEFRRRQKTGCDFSHFSLQQ